MNADLSRLSNPLNFGICELLDDNADIWTSIPEIPEVGALVPVPPLPLDWPKTVSVIVAKETTNVKNKTKRTSLKEYWRLIASSFEKNPKKTYLTRLGS